MYVLSSDNLLLPSEGGRLALYRMRRSSGAAMTRPAVHHANYKAFLDRVYREGDLVGVVLGMVSPTARQRATRHSNTTQRSKAAALRVWQVVMGKQGD